MARPISPTAKDFVTDPNWLKQKHQIEKLSIIEIGALIGLTGSSISRWLQKHGLGGRYKFRKGFHLTESHKQKLAEAKRGKKSGAWKGGKVIRPDNRIRIWKPNHPASTYGYVYEHRLIAEKILGRNLRNDEVIHHINGDPSDNNRANLMICSQADHMRLHAQQRKEKKDGD